ncbi:SsrA-binding protein SmpB [Candidatus Kapabacteria bacterium]|nr:SsrA-binding protein SmpB [Candidatus Kapabacteria bacterium]
METPEHRQREYKVITSNKKAFYNFHIIQTLEVGVQLTGTEVKSLRKSKCSLQESYCRFTRKNSHELYIINMNIPHFEQGNIFNHEPMRQRKLLIHKSQAKKWKSSSEEKAYTMVPTEIYFSGHLIKLEIALVKPKKLYDKRATEKERQNKREMDRQFKSL